MTLVPKVPVELAPVPEMKLEGPAQLMWIQWGCVLLRGGLSITAHLWCFGCSDDCITSKMDIQLCHSPGETNGTPLVDEMDRAIRGNLFYGVIWLTEQPHVTDKWNPTAKKSNLLLRYFSRSRAICCQEKFSFMVMGITGLWLDWEYPLLFKWNPKFSSWL